MQCVLLKTVQTHSLVCAAQSPETPHPYMKLRVLLSSGSGALEEEEVGTATSSQQHGGGGKALPQPSAHPGLCES